MRYTYHHPLYRCARGIARIRNRKYRRKKEDLRCRLEELQMKMPIE